MLWMKAWTETRLRFVIGFALTLCTVALVVLSWRKVMELLPLAANLQLNGEMGKELQEAIALSREFRSYVWSQLFAKNLVNLATLFAVLLGTGGVFSQRAGALFTLSLPVSRPRMLWIRGAMGLAELFAVIMLPSLAIPVFARSVGKEFNLGDSLVFGLCAFIVAAMFFALAFLLSTEFGDLWRPLLIALGSALTLGIIELFAQPSGAARWGIFRVMSAETYFRTGQMPWMGLLACVAASLVMFYVSSWNIARKDF